MIVLNPDLDLKPIIEEYRDTGLAYATDYLYPPLAEEIHQCLVNDVPWCFYSSNFEKDKDITPEQLDAMSPAEKEKLIPERPHSYTANLGSPFKTAQCRLAIKRQLDQGRYVPPVLVTVLKAMNDAPYVEVLKKLTGSDEVAGVSAAASWYKPGHYVTAHRDDGPARVATQLVTLTKDWQPGWGGKFTLCDNWGRIKKSIEPSFNSLILARPEIWHYVSVVSDEATSKRLTLYGWVQKHRHI